MFCPKCGLQNTESPRFCRGCGADISNVLAAVEGKTPDNLPQSLEYRDLFSSGIRNLILGFGFLFISLLLFTMPGDTFFWLLMMIPAISLLASGIPRLVKASGMKSSVGFRAVESNSFPKFPSNSALPPVQTEYISPEKSNYQTDDFIREPHSITDPTTKLLEIDGEGQTTELPGR